jgi:hypothetical protein
MTYIIRAFGLLAALLLVLTLSGCAGWWNVKPDESTANELKRSACVSMAYYQTRFLPDGTHLTDVELDIRLSHLRHLMQSRGLGTCDGVLP